MPFMDNIYLLPNHLTGEYGILAILSYILPLTYKDNCEHLLIRILIIRTPDSCYCGRSLGPRSLALACQLTDNRLKDVLKVVEATTDVGLVDDIGPSVEILPASSVIVGAIRCKQNETSARRHYVPLGFQSV